MMKKTGIPTAIQLFINTELTCADNFPGCAARYHASEPSSSTTLATIATPNACSLEIPRRATGQPHRQSHGTSFRQSNTALGMQQRVQVCGHRVDCEVGDLPDQDNHLSSKGWTKAWKVRSQDARERPDDSKSLSFDARGPRAVRCESHWELDIHSRDGCHAQMYASNSMWN